MISKTFEIRDSGTFIPVLAVKLHPSCEPDRYLFSRSGFGMTPQNQADYILLIKIDGGEGRACCDPYEWGTSARTMYVAHDHIIKHFDALPSGEVIDVEYVLGETQAPKQSERFNE